MNLRDVVDRNPLFDSVRDVRKYLEDYDEMMKYEPGMRAKEIDTMSHNIEKSKWKPYAEHYLKHTLKMLRKYGKWIDWTKTSETYDEMIQLNKEALEEIQELNSEDRFLYIGLFIHLDKCREFKDKFDEALNRSGLEPSGWYLEQLSEDNKVYRHSYCEKQDGENNGGKQ